MILLSLGCFILIGGASRICNFVCYFVVLILLKYFPKFSYWAETVSEFVLLNWYQIDAFWVVSIYCHSKKLSKYLSTLRLSTWVHLTSQTLTIRRILEGVRVKKPSGDITICRLYQGLRFHTQTEDGTNPTTIRPTKRNHSSNNDPLQKHKSESTFTRLRHGILRHCCRSTTRRHASPSTSLSSV